MGRPRNPERDKSKDRFLNSDGKLSNKELAEMAGVTEGRIRKWKHEDKWKDALSNKPKKRGGQPGNKNAVGKGAPTNNLNAVTHGAFRTIRLTDLTEEQRVIIDSLGLDPKENLLYELKSLVAKKMYLEDRISEYHQEAADTLHTDKVVEMYVPKSKKKDKNDSDECEEEEDEDVKEEFKTAMKTVVKASPFDRAMKLESELNKVHGRILKLLDTIKSYDLENKRLDLEERKYAFAKQKITGEFNIDPESGEIIDNNGDE